MGGVPGGTRQRHVGDVGRRCCRGFSPFLNLIESLVLGSGGMGQGRVGRCRPTLLHRFLLFLEFGRGLGAKARRDSKGGALGGAGRPCFRGLTKSSDCLTIRAPVFGLVS